MMSLKFNPMSESELIEAENQSLGLLEPGIYNFVVFVSSHEVSKKSGNEMLKLLLKVWDENGKEHTIFDYLVFSDKPFNIRKIKHFCESVGLEEEYKKGQLSENLSNLSGMAKIIIKEGDLKPDGTRYFNKNVVDDYIKSDKKEVKAEENKSDFPEDDIPF